MTVERRQRQLETELLSHRESFDKAEKKAQQLAHDLTTANRHISTLDSRLNSNKEEILELRRRLASKSSEIGGASEDLMLMTRENQALTRYFLFARFSSLFSLLSLPSSLFSHLTFVLAFYIIIFHLIS